MKERIILKLIIMPHCRWYSFDKTLGLVDANVRPPESVSLSWSVERSSLKASVMKSWDRYLGFWISAILLMKFIYLFIYLFFYLTIFILVKINTFFKLETGLSLWHVLTGSRFQSYRLALAICRLRDLLMPMAVSFQRRFRRHLYYISCRSFLWLLFLVRCIGWCIFPREAAVWPYISKNSSHTHFSDF